MAELAVGALGAGATLSAAKFASASGFTARHEASLHKEQSDTDRSSEAFARAYRSGDMSEEDWQKYLELKNDVVEKEEEYHQNLNEYKDTSMLNVIRKIRMRKNVREAKRKVRDANQKLRSHHSSVGSNASDASSIIAASGSPPGSGLEDERIRGWAEDVADATPSHPHQEIPSMPMETREAMVGPHRTRRTMPPLTDIYKRQGPSRPRLACLFCRSRKIVCDPGNNPDDPESCNQCFRRALKCVYPPQSRRRTRKKRDVTEEEQGKEKWQMEAAGGAVAGIEGMDTDGGAVA